MLWPSICVDDFFINPEEVVKFANSLEYAKDPDGRWPGERSQLLHLVDQNFFNYVGKKFLSVLYPISYRHITYQMRLCFQRISPKYKSIGWVHHDDEQEVTAICYLSKHKNCGTSIYNYKGVYPVIKNLEKKEKQYKTLSVKNEDLLVKENNENYEETISFKSKFNRVIMFDSMQHHAAHQFLEEGVQEDRLTLIGFFSQIQSPALRHHGTEMRRL